MQHIIELKNIKVDCRFSKIGHEIPLYYMRNFKLKDKEFISDLSNYSYVERILNDNEIQGKYSNEVGAHVETLIKNKIEDYKKINKPDLTYETQNQYLLIKILFYPWFLLAYPFHFYAILFNGNRVSGQSKNNI